MYVGPRAALVVMMLFALGFGFGESEGSETPGDQSVAQEEPAPGEAMTPFPEGAVPAVETAKGDLRVQLVAAELQIEVAGVEERTWSDASLGCPEPGRFYAQVLTPGYRIVLRVDGGVYVYHSGPGRVVRCSSDPG